MILMPCPVHINVTQVPIHIPLLGEGLIRSQPAFTTFTEDSCNRHNCI